MNTRLLSLITVLVLYSPFGWGAEPYVYPAKGQSAEQQEMDKYQCYNWAKDQTGVDPMVNQVPAQAQEKQGGALRGAARGAAIGAIVGNSDDAKTGAGVGAAMGRMRQNKANRDADQQAQNQNMQVQANRGEYDKAYNACLTGRGYTVN
jgi:hypothetical protein